VFPAVTRDLRAALGRNLQRLRQEHGLSQEAFADKTGIHRTYVGGIEHGERNVTLEMLERIAAAFDIDPVDLLK
jgi:transcriptional regulator with XRE-family HTH domain